MVESSVLARTVGQREIYPAAGRSPGFEDLSDGTISIGEREVNQLDPDERRHPPSMFQNYALYQRVSC